MPPPVHVTCFAGCEIARHPWQTCMSEGGLGSCVRFSSFVAVWSGVHSECFSCKLYPRCLYTEINTLFLCLSYLAHSSWRSWYECNVKVWHTTFHTAVDASVRSWHLLPAWHLLETMRAAGMTPDNHTCFIFDICLANEMEK